MSKLRNDFVVGCTPEEAFDWLSDQRNELVWNEGYCLSVEKITDGPIGAGSKFRAKWKGSPEIEIELLEFERPRRWKARSDGQLESRFECTIEPHPDGARIVSELELIPHGVFKLLFPLFKRGFAKHEGTAPGKMTKALHEHYGVEKVAA